MAGSIQVSGELFKGQLENGKWIVDDKDLLLRLLCLGSIGRVYTGIDLTDDMNNIMCVVRLVSNGRGTEVLDIIKEMSLKRRAPKMDVLISVYAYLVTQREDLIVKRLALDSILEICKIPPHLFLFVHYSEKFANIARQSSGWGSGKRKAVAKWYNQFADDPQKLAMYVTKYQRRHGWSHVDVLRLAHVQPANQSIEVVLNYAMKGLANTSARFPQYIVLLSYFQAIEDVKRATPIKTPNISNLITQQKLVREHIPPQTRLLNEPQIWMALLQKMPLQAILRNLNKMTNKELLNPGSAASKTVCCRLSNVADGQVHPLSILVAQKAYREKFGIHCDVDIDQALSNAFTSAFKGEDKTALRFCLAIDLDVSMNEKVHKCPILKAKEAAAAMAYVTVKTEPSCDILVLGACERQIDNARNYSPQEFMDIVKLEEVGLSDCSRPLKWATMNKKIYDVFIVYTSCVADFNEYPAAKALADYRLLMKNPTSKLIVCAMTTKDYTNVNPKDPGMLNIAGFDACTPDIITNYVTYLKRD